MITKYHAKYYATVLSNQAIGGQIDSLSQSLLNAAVDINPRQIEAALFAFQSPLSKGVIFADEVGLGKTIEAGLVLYPTIFMMISSTASVYLPWAISLLRIRFSARSITRHSVSVRYRYRFFVLMSFDLL